MEMEFERIDVNQCPPGEGNNGPNLFADTARCKKETTEVQIQMIAFFRNCLQCINCNFSVNHCMDGALEEGVISVGAHLGIGFHYRREDHFWEKSLSELQQNNTITDSIVLK